MRLLRGVVVLLAGAAAQPRSRRPAHHHQREMQARLADAARHVLHGGPHEEKLHRVRDLVELHNGFVTDMIATYRPSLMHKWVDKVTRLARLVGPRDARGRGLTESTETSPGPCFDSHAAEWGCVLSSCWCDRAFDDSVSGPEISTSCDDSSEYTSYAYAARASLSRALRSRAPCPRRR